MARPPKTEKEKLSEVIAWRVTKTVKDELGEQYKESGLTQSEFLRELLEHRKATIVAKPKSSLDKKKITYLYKKSSNNINQIAHSVNTAKLAGKISEPTFLEVARQLDVLNALLKEGIDNVD